MVDNNLPLDFHLRSDPILLQSKITFQKRPLLNLGLIGNGIMIRLGNTGLAALLPYDIFRRFGKRRTSQLSSFLIDQCDEESARRALTNLRLSPTAKEHDMVDITLT